MTPTQKNTEKHVAVSMKAKETLVRKSSFPKPPTNLAKLLILSSRTTYLKVTPKVVL